MADITRDTYNRADRHSKVIFQRDRDVLDSELNEFQDIIRVMAYSMLFHASQKDIFAGSLNPGSNDNGWKVVGTGAPNQVTVSAGTLFCDGIPLFNDSPYIHSAGLVTPVADHVAVVYLSVTEAEIPDPAPVPQLGETTRRRQIQVNTHVTLSGLAGVPANTVTEIWQGGVRYYPLASINRFTGQSAVNSGDVTDLRKLLPPSLFAAIARQGSGLVQALQASIIETPDGSHMQTATTSLTMDLDPAEALAKPYNFLVRQNRDTPNSRVNMDLSVFSPSTVLNLPQTFGSLTLRGAMPLVPPVGLEYLIIRSDTNDFAFADVASTHAVPFAARQVGTERLRTAHHSSGSDKSVMTLLNGRWVVTVGDGINTFGEFNGTAGIHALFDEIQAASLLGDVAVHVRFKAGLYSNVNPSAVFLNPVGKIDMTFEGVGEASVLRLSGTFLKFPGGYLSEVQFHFENLSFESFTGDLMSVLNYTGTFGAPGFNGAFPLTSLTFSRCRVKQCAVDVLNPLKIHVQDTHWTGMGTAPSVSDNRHLFNITYRDNAGDGISERSNEANRFGLVSFDRCTLHGVEDTVTSLGRGIVRLRCGQASSSQELRIRGVRFADCFIRTYSTLLDTPIAPYLLQSNPGIISVDNQTNIGVLQFQSILGLHIQHIEVRNCQVIATDTTGAGSIQPILLHLTSAPENQTPDLVTFGQAAIDKVSLLDSDFRVEFPSLGTVNRHLSTSPFVLALTRTKVVVRECTFGFIDQNSSVLSIIQTPADSALVTIGEFTANLGYWLNGGMATPWAPGEWVASGPTRGAFMAIYGDTVHIDGIHLRNMRQTQRGSDAWITWGVHATVKRWRQEVEDFVPSPVVGASVANKPMYRVFFSAGLNLNSFAHEGGLTVDDFKMSLPTGSVDLNDVDWVYDATNVANAQRGPGAFVCVEGSTADLVLNNAKIDASICRYSGSGTNASLGRLIALGSSQSAGQLGTPTPILTVGNAWGNGVHITNCRLAGGTNGVSWRPNSGSYAGTKVANNLFVAQREQGFIFGNPGDASPNDCGISFVGNSFYNCGSEGIRIESGMNLINTPDPDALGGAKLHFVGNSFAACDPVFNIAVYVNNRTSGVRGGVPLAAHANMGTGGVSTIPPAVFKITKDNSAGPTSIIAGTAGQSTTGVETTHSGTVTGRGWVSGARMIHNALYLQTP